jgi:iron complex transport system substrate-binding protein
VANVGPWFCATQWALAVLGAAACGRTPTPSGDRPTAASTAPAVTAAAAAAGAATAAAIPPAGERYPIRLRDDRGVVVTVAAEPRRIVALLPSHTETLFALGVGERVVGVDDYSDYPGEVARLPRLGGLYDVRLEALVALEPDLVLCSESASAIPALERSGLTVWAGSAQRFEDIFRVIHAIAELVDRRAEAKRLCDHIDEDAAAIESRVRGREPVSVYYELDANLYAAGPSSFLGVLLTKAGGRNIVPTALGDFPKISPETVIAGDPSVILGAPLDEVARRPGWTRIAAVRSGRVYKLPPAESRLVLHSGPRIAEGLRVLARRLHPEVAQ